MTCCNFFHYIPYKKVNTTLYLLLYRYGYNKIAIMCKNPVFEVKVRYSCIGNG